MKVANRVSGWQIEGMFITIFPRDVPLDAQEIRAYFGVDQKSPRFAGLQRASSLDRIVLMKPDNQFVIVPINKQLVIDPTLGEFPS